MLFTPINVDWIIAEEGLKESRPQVMLDEGQAEDQSSVIFTSCDGKLKTIARLFPLNSRMAQK